MATAAVTYQGPERRRELSTQALSAQGALLSEIHNTTKDIRRRLFEGADGVPPMTVEIANLQSCQNQQGKDLADMESEQRADRDKIWLAIDANTKAIGTLSTTVDKVAGSVKLMLSGWRFLLVGLLVPVAWAIITFGGDLLTHAKVVTTPAPAIVTPWVVTSTPFDPDSER